MRIFLACLQGGFIGFGLSVFCNLYFNEWRFWATIVPILILSALREAAAEKHAYSCMKKLIQNS